MTKMRALIFLKLVAYCAIVLLIGGTAAENDSGSSDSLNRNHADLEAAPSDTHAIHGADIPDMEPSEGIIHEITAEGRSIVGDFIRNWRSRVGTAVRKTFTGATDDDTDFNVGVRRPIAVIPPLGHPMHQIGAPNLGPQNNRHPGNNRRHQQPGYRQPGGQANIRPGFGSEQRPEYYQGNYGGSAGSSGMGHFQNAPAGREQQQKWRPAAAIEVEIDLPHNHQSKQKHGDSFRPLKQENKPKLPGNKKPSHKFTTTTEGPVSLVTVSPWAHTDDRYSEYPASFEDYAVDFPSQPAKIIKQKGHSGPKAKAAEKKAQYKLSGFVGGGPDEHVFDVGASLSFGGGSGAEKDRPEFTKGKVSDVSLKARGSTKHFPAPASPEPAPPKYAEKRHKVSNKKQGPRDQPHLRQPSSKNDSGAHYKKQGAKTAARSSSYPDAVVSPAYPGASQTKARMQKSKPETIQARQSTSQKRQDRFDDDDDIGYWPDEFNRHDEPAYTSRSKPAATQDKLKPKKKVQSSTTRQPYQAAAASRESAGYGSKTNKRPWTPSQVMYSRNFTQNRHSQYPVTDLPTAATEDMGYAYEAAPSRYNSQKGYDGNEYYYSGTKTSKYHQQQIQNAQKDHSPVRKFLKIVRSSLASEGFQFPNTDLLTRTRIPLGAVSDMVQIIAALRTSMDPSMDAFLRGTFTDATEKIAGYLRHLVPFDLPMSYFLHGKFLMDRLSNLTSFLSPTHHHSWDRAKNVVALKDQQENSATSTAKLSESNDSTTEPTTSNEVPTSRKRSKRSPQDMPKEASEMSTSYYGWYKEYLKQDSPSKRRRDVETCKDLKYDYYQRALAKPGRQPSNEVDSDSRYDSDPVFYTPDRVEIVSDDSFKTKKQPNKPKKSKNKQKNKQADFSWENTEGLNNQPNKNGKKKNTGKTKLNRDDALYVDDYIDYSDLSLLPNTYEKTRKKPVAVVESAELANPAGAVVRPGKDDYVYYYYYDDDEEEEPKKNSPKNEGQGKNRNKRKNQEFRGQDKKAPAAVDEYYDDEDEPQAPAVKQRPTKRQPQRNKQPLQKAKPSDEEYYDYYYDDDEQPANGGKGGSRKPPGGDNYQPDEDYDDGEDSAADAKRQSSGKFSFFGGQAAGTKSKESGRGNNRNKKVADSRKDPWYKSFRMPRISMLKPDLSILKKLDPRSVVSSIKRQDPFVTFGGLSFGAFIAALMYAVMSDMDPGAFTQSKFSELGQFDIMQVYDRMSDLLARDPALRSKRSYGSQAGKRRDEEEDGILLPADDVSRSSSVDDDDRTELRCAMDSLWTAFEDDPLAKQCLRLSLCQSIVEAPAVKSDKNYSMRVLLLTTFSWMLGDQESFQFANDVEDQVIRRTGFKCSELSPLCRASRKKYMAKLASEVK